MARRSTARTGKKLYYKIGEVCEMTETEPYVLRYWESEFPFLAPEKNRAGQRIYSADDIETVNTIKRLLYEEGYTTAGARRRLEREREDGSGATAEAPESGGVAGTGSPELAKALRAVREGLSELRELMSSGGRSSPAGGGSDRRERPAKATSSPARPARKGKATKKASSRKKRAAKKTSTRKKPTTSKKR